MKGLIKKILKENLDDFDWIEDINPFEKGEFFKNSEICFDSATCEVNIKNNELVLIISFDKWFDFMELPDEDRHYIESFLYNPNYQSHYHNDYLDDEEFNYSYGWLTDEQKTKFQNILNIFAYGKKIEDFSDSMLEIGDYLKYEKLKNFFNDLTSEYVGIISDNVERNRWINMSKVFDGVIKETGCDWDLYYRGEGLEITIPIDLVWDNYGHGFNNLTDLLRKISEPFTNEYFSDSFWDDFSTEGSESDVIDLFNNFLEKVEDFLEENDLSRFKYLESLFKHYKLKEIKKDTYIRINPNKTKWLINLDYDNERAFLRLYNNDELTTENPRDLIISFKIPMEELSNYINNYHLDHFNF